MPPPHSDAIADCVLNAFHALPTKFKARKLADGRREWVPLAGIVLSKDAVNTSSQQYRGSERLPVALTPASQPFNRPPATTPAQLTCVALATGMKCLPQSKLALAKGNVLHDWHAEILAIRAFNRFLVDECADLARGVFGEGKVGAWVRWRRRGAREENWTTSKHEEKALTPFELHEDVRIHMYCSEAPCGDASMELVMAEQEDSTPWARDTEATPATTDNGMLGRGHFDQLGIVRRKPARSDAPITLSKSCSDKLAMKQCTSLLSGLTSTLVWPGSAYLSTLVLPESAYVPAAIQRAFGATGRMAAVPDSSPSWNASGYAFIPFEVKTTSRAFEFSKRAGEEVVPSNLSALATTRRQEVLINGVLQGRKQSDAKGASCVSRRRLWEDVVEVAASAGVLADVDGLEANTYGGLKGSTLMERREGVKRDVRMGALKGWRRNVGDEDWKIGDA